MPVFQKIKTSKGEHSLIRADKDFSFLTHPEQTTQFFVVSANSFHIGIPVHFDFSMVESVTDDAICMLISHLKDPEINNGNHYKVIFPESKECKKAFRNWSIFQKVEDHYEKGDEDDFEVIKVPGVKVENEFARDVCSEISIHLFGEERRIRDVYEVVIEIMANTHDHACGGFEYLCQWWLFVRYCDDQSVELIFLDHGVGLFESIPVKQHMERENIITAFFPGASVAAKNQRQKELARIFSDLTGGKIKSSTGLPERGKGIPLIAQNAAAGMFERFVIVSNDAHIDVLSRKVSVMDTQFIGTLLSMRVSESS